MLIQEQSIGSLDISDLDLDGGEEIGREESKACEIEEESHVEEIEEKRQDVEENYKS